MNHPPPPSAAGVDHEADTPVGAPAVSWSQDDLALAEAIAESARVLLHLDGEGDPASAWHRWLALRDAVDLAVARRLWEEPVTHRRDLFAAVGVSLSTGLGDVEALVGRARDQALDPESRADAQRALAKLGTWRGDTLRTATLTERAAVEIAPFDGRREAELRLDATTTLLHAGHLGWAEEAARRAVDASHEWSELAATANVLLSCVGALMGDPAEVEVPKDEVMDGLGPDDVRLGVLVGNLLVWTGRHDDARRLLGRTEAMARKAVPEALPFVVAAVADLDHRAGWWRSGETAAQEGEAAADRSGSRNVRALLLVRSARFDAARGDRSSCLARLAEVDRIEQAAGLISVRLHAASVRALLAAGEGDHEEALAHAQRARRVGEEMTLRHPGVDLFHGELIEALVRTDQRGLAALVIDELTEIAQRLSYSPALAVAARGRLLIADEDQIEPLARAALDFHDQVPIAFERARTNLVLGERRRRAGRRRDARAALADAHGEFARLGALPWANRALAELRAAGGRAATGISEVAALRVLSPQEQQVARLVADGATNQEAATALFLSQKSIERHLTTTYRKLGLRSRTELARWFDLTSTSPTD